VTAATVGRLPDVRSPFPSRLNPYTGEAERRALRWARRVGLITSAEVVALAGQRFGRLTGRCHPGFGLTRLADVCRWYLWFAVLDDRYCDRSERPGELSQRLAVISRVLDDPGTVTSDPVGIAPLAVRASCSAASASRAKANTVGPHDDCPTPTAPRGPPRSSGPAGASCTPRSRTSCSR